MLRLAWLLMVGATGLLVLPLYVGLIGAAGTYSPSDLALLAGIDVFGLALGALAGWLLQQRVAGRWLADGGAGLILLASAVGLLVGTIPDADLFIAHSGSRFVAEFGGGLLSAAAYRWAALHTSPQQVFGAGLVAVMSQGIVVLLVIPQFLETYGTAALLVTHIGFALSAVLMIPRSSEAPRQQVSDPPEFKQLIAPIIAMSCCWAALGTVWSFAERLGDVAGLGLQDVGNGMAAASVASLLGSLAATILGLRLLRLGPLIFGLGIFAAACLAPLLPWSAATGWVVLLLATQFGFGFAAPYLLALGVNFDRSGSSAALLPVFTNLGFALGPMAVVPFSTADYAAVTWVALAWTVAALVVGARCALLTDRTLGGEVAA